MKKPEKKAEKDPIRFTNKIKEFFGMSYVVCTECGSDDVWYYEDDFETKLCLECRRRLYPKDF